MFLYSAELKNVNFFLLQILSYFRSYEYWVVSNSTSMYNTPELILYILFLLCFRTYKYCGVSNSIILRAAFVLF